MQVAEAEAVALAERVRGPGLTVEEMALPAEAVGTEQLIPDLAVAVPRHLGLADLADLA